MLDEITTYILKASVSWQESVKEILRNQADEEAKTQIQKWFADPWDLTVHVEWPSTWARTEDKEEAMWLEYWQIKPGKVWIR